MQTKSGYTNFAVSQSFDSVWSRRSDGKTCVSVCVWKNKIEKKETEASVWCGCACRDEVDSLLFIHAKIHRISICVLQPHIRPNESFDPISHMHTHKVPAFNLQCIIQMNLLNKYRAFVFSLCSASTGQFSAVFERYLIVLSSIKLPRMCVTHAHI